MKLFGRKGLSKEMKYLVVIIVALLILCLGFGYCLRFTGLEGMNRSCFWREDGSYATYICDTGDTGDTSDTVYSFKDLSSKDDISPSSQHFKDDNNLKKDFKKLDKDIQFPLEKSKDLFNNDDNLYNYYKQETDPFNYIQIPLYSDSLY